MRHKNSLIALSVLGLTSALTTAPAVALSFDSVTISQEVDLSSYTKIYIAPVSIDIKKERTGAVARLRSKRPAISTSEAEEKGKDFFQILSHKLGERVTLVDTPGPDILTVSPKITKLVPSRYNTVEGALNVSRDQIRSVTSGGASIEFSISENSTPIMVIRDSFQTSLNDGAPRTTRWQDADDAFNSFSKDLAKKLTAK